MIGGPPAAAPWEDEMALERTAEATEAEGEALVRESEIREALRQVVDPEINIDVVTLGLIREVVQSPELVEVRMLLTTPFCPYAGSLVQQVKDVTRAVTGIETKVTLLDDPWTPDLMEGGDWAEWGLI